MIQIQNSLVHKTMTAKIPFLALLLFLLSAGLISAAEPKAEIDQAISKIGLMGKVTTDPDNLAFVNDMVVKWAGYEDKPLVSRLLTAISTQVSEKDFVSVETKSLQAQIFFKSIETLGDVGLPLQVSLLKTAPFNISDGLDVNAKDFKDLRNARHDKLLRFYVKLEEKVKGPPPRISSTPETPREWGLRRGVSPKSVKDPVIRAKYIELLKAHTIKVQAANNFYELQRDSKKLYRSLVSNISDAYAVKPFDTPGARMILKRRKLSGPQIKEILAAIDAKKKAALAK